MTTAHEPPPRVSAETNPPQPHWDAYVAAHPAASVYQLAGWTECARRLFGLEAYYLSARNPNGQLAGILPLARQRSRVFGDRLTSLPYFNYGGPLAGTDAIRTALMDRARALAEELRVDRLELRDTLPPPPGWSYRLDKVSMIRDLPGDEASLQKQLGSKLRSQVKRALRESPEVAIGGLERVDDFYTVFAQVMHDLGTPVYPKRFFECLATELADYCTVVTLSLEGRPVSGAFLVGYRDLLEIPWAGTIAAMRPKSINMALYWEVLRLAVARGYRRFDFGRSSPDSGTFHFKKQWGAQPIQLHWATWPGTPGEVSTSAGPGPGQALVTGAWRRLPLAVANRLGPLVSPNLPW